MDKIQLVRSKKFCHIHETEEGQVLFRVEKDKDGDGYSITATFSWEEFEISVSMTPENFTRSEAVDCLRTMDYQKYTSFALEEIKKQLEGTLFIL